MTMTNRSSDLQADPQAGLQAGVNADLRTDLQAALETAAAPARIPRATYRLQFNADFTFRDAQAIVPYLHRLGVSHLYASPILQARPGSTHGYDICDYGRLNDVLGTDEDFNALVAALHEHDMGLIVDIVPNHMGIDADCNQWWIDVLENGPSSRYASYFDITWSPVKHELDDKVLLPLLEDQYGIELENGKFQAGCEDGEFFVRYNTIRLPLTPDTYAPILQDVVAHLADLSENEDLLELKSIVTALQNLPTYQERDPEQQELRHREKDIIKRRLRLLVEASEVIRVGIQSVLTDLNGTPDDPESFDRLDAILSAQPYRIAFWRVASDEINYRRFFDINEMAAIRVEQPEVFEAVHARVRQMIEAGQLDGLRIDHPDGLWDPSAYFIDLQRLYLKARLKDVIGEEPSDDADALIDALISQRLEAGQRMPPFYVVVEKILSETEPLPQDWSVYGTTGYDFLNQVNGLFVQSDSETRLNEIYHRFIQRGSRFTDLVYDAKILIMEKSLSSEIRAISHELERITEISRRHRDFTLVGLTQAIREIIASMSIYRTYITDAETVSDRDRRYILEAVVNARRRNPSIPRLLFSFIRDTLLLHNLDQFSPENRQRVVNFVMKFQQITGPVMAKSLEDTVFYMYNRLVSLNEVGGHPEQFGISIESFHAQNLERSQTWGHTMLASSTHDTKRSEDMRARISVLSEITDEWEAAVRRWAEMNADKKVAASGINAPDANDEYLYYQTLIGIWEAHGAPAAAPDAHLRDRLTAYMTKAANEAKVHTSWLDQDEEYIAALGQFIARTLDDADFLNDFIVLQRRVAFHGRINALSQTLLKLTSPGVPDIYQGTEGWHLALVDPDNRRAVDFSRYDQLLDEIDGIGEGHRAVGQMPESADDGRIKLYTHAAVLELRRQHPMLFEQGSYTPLYTEGPLAEHVCAFARQYEDLTMIVAVPRLSVGLTEGELKLPLGDAIWQGTALSLGDMGRKRAYRNLFTQAVLNAEEGRLRLSDVFGEFPIALLVSE